MQAVTVITHHHEMEKINIVEGDVHESHLKVLQLRV